MFRAMKKASPPKFLRELLEARSPSGYEHEAQAVWDHHVGSVADETRRDAMGNRISVLNPKGDPVLMFAGHIDELGLIITHVDKLGFLYFKPIGGHDRSLISGRRVVIQSRKGPVLGVTGKRAIHTMTQDERGKVPELHHMWIDIGARDREDALKRVSIGDVATYDVGIDPVYRSVATARAFDNKAGAYVVGETLIRLSEARKRLAARVVSVATTQEEIGVRGATTAAYSVNPHVAIAVDVTHATDHPDSDHRKLGDVRLGGGPVVCRGPNINPWVLERIETCAKKEKIDIQYEADPRPTGTDARAIQIGREGVATGLVSIPLRYMHTPCEMVDLEDVENCIRLLVAFALSLKPGEYGHW